MFPSFARHRVTGRALRRVAGVHGCPWRSARRRRAFSPALIAEPFAERWRDGTVGDLLILVQTSMPKEQPATLGAEVYADIVTYLLKMNNYPAGQTELGKDIAQSKDIRFRR